MAGFVKRAKLAVIGMCAAAWFVSSLAVAQAGKENPQLRRGVSSGMARDGPSAEAVRSALSRASTLLEADKFKDAAATLNSLSCLRCDPRISLLLAAALEGGGELSKARGTLEEAHSLWPTNNSIATALARQYVLAGRADQAAEALSSSDVSATTPAQELALRVQVDLAVHRLLEAERVAKIAYEAHPSEASTLILANVLQMQGRRDEVVTFLRSKRKLYGDSPRFLVTLAEGQYDTVNYAAARADLERAISLDPGMEIAHYLLGNTLVRLKEADAAIDEYNSAIRLAPRKARTHYGLGLALLLRADDAGAEGALKNSLAIDPQYAPAHCELGKLYQKQGRLPEAVEELNSAIQCNPRYTVAYYHLGETYRQMGDKRDSVKAFAAFQALKEKEPKQKPPMNDRLP